MNYRLIFISSWEMEEIIKCQLIGLHKYFKLLPGKKINKIKSQTINWEIAVVYFQTVLFNRNIAQGINVSHIYNFKFSLAILKRNR